MTYTDYRAEAAKLRRESAKAYARSRRDAAFAASQYAVAARQRAHAAWLTRRPEMWDDPSWDTPAQHEGYARSSQRLADTYLRSVYSDRDNARCYAQLARQYDVMAAGRDARSYVNDLTPAAVKADPFAGLPNDGNDEPDPFAVAPVAKPVVPSAAERRADVRRMIAARGWTAAIERAAMMRVAIAMQSVGLAPPAAITCEDVCAYCGMPVMVAEDARVVSVTDTDDDWCPTDGHHSYPAGCVGAAYVLAAV